MPIVKLGTQDSESESDVLKKPECGRCAELRDVLESYAGDVDGHKEHACLDCTERRAQRSVPCTPVEACNCALFMCDCWGEDDPQQPPTSPPAGPGYTLPHYKHGRTAKHPTSSPVTPEARWHGSPSPSSDEDISFM